MSGQAGLDRGLRVTEGRGGFDTIGLLHSLAGCAVLLMPAAASGPATTVAQASAVGGSEFYVADFRQASGELGLSSSIELRPDGRFDWRMQMGQLTLSARGEWQREGPMIRLHNPEQVGEPAIELAGASRDPADLLRVSLEPATARMASVLQLELEYPGNSYLRVPLGDGGISIPAGEEGPMAVRLMSEPFGFRTQPIELAPGGANVVTLRLAPADLGQAFFASQQSAFDERGMTLDWRGIAIRYERVPAPPRGN